MNDAESRGLLRTIRVPFDIKAIFLGAVGYLIFIAGGWILDALFAIEEGAHVVSGFIHQGLDLCAIRLNAIPVIGGEMTRLVETLYGRPPSEDLGFWQMLVTGLWFLLVLSVFGGAIARIIAMRIARDESVSAKEAVSFSMQNLLSYLLLPVFLGAAILFFWVCNVAAGFASSIPGFGPFLFIVLFPLVILSALIILLIAVGGVLGLFLMVAAVSAEKNGTLDAISRAFSYIYSRPLPFFFYYFLVFLLASIIVLIGVNIFLGDVPAFDRAPDANWGIVASSFFEGTVDGSNMDKGFPVGVNAALSLDKPSFEDPLTQENLSIFPAIGALVSWFFMIVLKIMVLGFVVAYIMGGTTSIYFALRRDVDGTEDSEIYVEGLEDEEDFGLPPVSPPPEEEEEAAEEEEEEEAEEKKAEEKPKPAKKKAKKKAAKKKAAKKEEKAEEEKPSEEE